MPTADTSLLSGLTVVLSCFDDAAHLRAAVRSATDAAEHCARCHEIVIVDDGSTDDTIAVAGELASRDHRVQLVVHASRRGYAEALRSGIAAARMEWVLMIDAGLQVDVAELRNFFGSAGAVDLIVGHGIPLDASVPRPLWRRVLHLPIRAPDRGYRLARRELLAGLDLRADGALARVELLDRSRAAGARVADLTSAGR